MAGLRIALREVPDIVRNEKAATSPRCAGLIQLQSAMVESNKGTDGWFAICLDDLELNVTQRMTMMMLDGRSHPKYLRTRTSTYVAPD